MPSPPGGKQSYGGGAPGGTEDGVAVPAAGVDDAGVVCALGPQPAAVQRNALITIMLRSAFIVFLLLNQRALMNQREGIVVSAISAVNSANCRRARAGRGESVGLDHQLGYAQLVLANLFWVSSGSHLGLIWSHLGLIWVSSGQGLPRSVDARS